ncbi:MAG: hypothetical protein JNL97_03670, partial [Verrucomicrobiales bacterium]|nr:hypothetical protein [Verrucomicrobiales bacterium]
MNSLRRHARSKAAAAMLALAGVVCWIGCDRKVQSLPASDPNPPHGETASTSPPPAPAPHPDPSLGRINPETASRLLALEAQEAEADRTIWAAEIQAARCGAVFDALWDQLNASTSRWEVLRRFDPGSLTLPEWETPRPEVHGILVHAPKTVESPVSATTWATLTERWAETGWSLLQCEFRHVRFDTNSAGLPDRSRFAFSAHFVRAQPEERAVLEGPLEVAWRVDTDAAGLPRIES